MNKNISFSSGCHCFEILVLSEHCTMLLEIALEISYVSYCVTMSIKPVNSVVICT